MADLSSLSFRSAGLGGFNKKDVITYIKSLTDKYSSELKKAERALAESEKQKELLSARAEAAEKALAAAGDPDSLPSKLEASQKEYAALTEKLLKNQIALEEAEVRCAALQAENALLKDEKEKSGEVLGKLEKEKQMVAELELEARVRARESEESARSRIASIISTYQSEFSDARDSFRRYKASADRLISATEDQLRDMLTLFGELENELELSEKAFEKLSDDPAEK